MKRIILFCIVVSSIWTAGSSFGATDIVNNLAESTHSQGEQFDGAFPSQRGAQAFTPDSNNYTLDSISVEFAGYGGTSSAEISLWSDVGGFPGSAIETLGNVTIPGTGGGSPRNPSVPP